LQHCWQLQQLADALVGCSDTSGTTAIIDCLEVVSSELLLHDFAMPLRVSSKYDAYAISIVASCNG
jgi:hypothetical protein